jgi:energy-coupling factor transporter ATP-binding protein EcfA2
MALTFEQQPNKLTYCGFLLALGALSLLTVRLQSSWLKMVRPAFLLGGAIAGTTLLIDYRSPSKLDDEQTRIEKEAEAQRLEIEQERQRLYQEQAEIEARLQAWADETKTLFEQQLTSERETYETVIDSLKTRLAELGGVKRPKGNSRIEWIADRVIDVFLEYGIACDYEDSHEIPGEDLIWLTPRQGVKVSQVRALSDELQLRIAGIDYPPAISLTDEACIEISIKVSVEKQRRERASIEDELIEPAPDWFIEMIQHPEVNHLRVAGESGSGKSTLIDNYICLAKKELGDDVNIIIIDPKFPDTKWVIDGVEIIPQFKGYERLKDETGTEHPSALEGLIAMQQDVRDRLSKAATEKLAGKDITERKPTIYVVDEAEDLIGTFGEDAAEPIRSVLRVGRSTKVKAVIIGQDPGCRSYKMQKANFRNAAQIFLRENATAGIEEVGLTRTQKTELKKQVGLRQLLAENDRSKRFYGVIKYPGCPAFCANMPSVGAFRGRALPPTELPVVSDAVSAQAASEQEYSVYSGGQKTPQNGQNNAATLADTIEREAKLERLDCILLEIGNDAPLTQIIPRLYPEVEGLERTHRRWQKAREDYRRLTGK